MMSASLRTMASPAVLRNVSSQKIKTVAIFSRGKALQEGYAAIRFIVSNAK
jgi:hypothetical protein